MTVLTESDLNAICRHENCRKPYGEHAQFGSWCLVGDRFSASQKFSEDVFQQELSSSGSVSVDGHAAGASATKVADGFDGGRERELARSASTVYRGLCTLPDSLTHGLCRDVSCNRLECQRDLREHQQRVLLESICKAPLVTVNDGFVEGI